MATPLLLHACCGPCSLEPVKYLREAGFEPTICWCNPNIQPVAEHDHRLDVLMRWAHDVAHVQVIVAADPRDAWESAAAPAGFDRERRCRACYAVRLTEAEVGEGGVVTVQWCKEGGRNEDRVHFYAYSPMCGTGLTVATVERGRRRGRFVLPAQFAGADVHLWAVAENAAGEVSPTAYILLSVDTADVEGGGAPSSQLLNAAESEAMSLSRPNLPEVTVGFGEFPPGEAPH